MLQSLTPVALWAASGTAEGETMANPIIPHLPELVWSLVVFGILWAVVAKKFVPTFEKTYAERRDAIEGDMSRAEIAMAEATELKRQYETQITEARSEAARVREEAREQGAAIIAEMRDQAQVEAARIHENAQRQIAAERSQAMSQLKGEVGRMSTDLASRIVGESLHDETRQKGIVERFIADLEAGRLAVGHGEPAREPIPREVDF